MKNIPVLTPIKSLFSILAILFFSGPLVAQVIKEGIPQDPNSLNFESAEGILLYIILPLTVIILLIFWFYKRTKKHQNQAG